MTTQTVVERTFPQLPLLDVDSRQLLDEAIATAFNLVSATQRTSVYEGYMDGYRAEFEQLRRALTRTCQRLQEAHPTSIGVLLSPSRPADGWEIIVWCEYLRLAEVSPQQLLHASKSVGHADVLRQAGPNPPRHSWLVDQFTTAVDELAQSLSWCHGHATRHGALPLTPALRHQLVTEHLVRMNKVCDDLGFAFPIRGMTCEEASKVWRFNCYRIVMRAIEPANRP